MRLLKILIQDQRGLAAMEATILLAGLAVAVIGIGATVAPAVHSYADNLTNVTVRAETALKALQANSTGAANSTTGP